MSYMLLEENPPLNANNNNNNNINLFIPTGNKEVIHWFLKLKNKVLAAYNNHKG